MYVVWRYAYYIVRARKLFVVTCIPTQYSQNLVSDSDAVRATQPYDLRPPIHFQTIIHHVNFMLYPGSEPGLVCYVRVGQRSEKNDGFFFSRSLIVKL